LRNKIRGDLNMPKIVLFGGNSEIGMSIAQNYLKENSQYGSILCFLRSEEGCGNKDKTEFRIWDTDNYEKLQNALLGSRIEKDDLVIISLGRLGANYITSDVKNDIDAREISLCIESNLTIPMTVLAFSVNALSKAGGGRVIVLSSAAAFPPLEPNSYYASSKLALDAFALSIFEEAKKRKVLLSVIRPGFVPTKLNAHREATVFGTSLKKLSRRAIRSTHSRVIWEPRILRYVTLAIRALRPLQTIASKQFIKSHQID
jgi:decaprenylphospho-beta-D-erythro-pentofuranosid-2-ulose 2-reductase